MSARGLHPREHLTPKAMNIVGRDGLEEKRLPLLTRRGWWMQVCATVNERTAYDAPRGELGDWPPIGALDKPDTPHLGTVRQGVNPCGAVSYRSIPKASQRGWQEEDPKGVGQKLTAGPKREHNYFHSHIYGGALCADAPTIRRCVNGL